MIFLSDAGDDMSDVGQNSVWIILLNLPVYVLLKWLILRLLLIRLKL